MVSSQPRIEARAHKRKPATMMRITFLPIFGDGNHKATSVCVRIIAACVIRLMTVTQLYEAQRGERQGGGGKIDT